MKVCSILIFFFSVVSVFADSTKTYVTQRVKENIIIDGKLDDGGWINIPVAGGFIQSEPIEGAAVAHQTEIRLAYDNTAIYVAAKMYDSPDSILRQLGKRDENSSLNADEFKLGIDPYNLRQDGYVFHVTASGVQGDERASDPTYDAVWQSAVQLTDEGWNVEMKIPFSAIRIPKKDVQTWAVQFARFTRRTREYDQWSLTPKSSNNTLIYWGTLTGLTNIEPPLRLSVTPYLTLYAENSPSSDEKGALNYQSLKSYSVGADLKYGIDERFTFDMTLLPDFSQVQSDNKVKNLSAFETIYSENRPFFKEGVELFSKGGLFYSRRIGQTPSHFYSVSGELLPGESVIENPDKARLLNGMKVSGRTDKGLGIGVFNAVTGNTYAVIRTPEGGTRKILTEPLTNYNIVVFDQNLPHNSDVYFINTNVMREGATRDANVTTGFGAYELKNHKYRFSSRYSQSRIYENNSVRNGEQLGVMIDRVEGEWRYGGLWEFADNNYDKNDMGSIFYRDYMLANFYLNYNRYEPYWKIFKMGFASLGYYSDWKRSTGDLTSIDVYVSGTLITNDNYSFNFSVGGQPLPVKDFYEPRTAGRYYAKSELSYQSMNFSTNYNKRLAFDFGGRHSSRSEQDYFAYGYYLTPILRLSDKWSFKFLNMWDKYFNDRGWVTTFSYPDSVIFGERNILTIENSLTTRYLFKNDMALSVTARHYWSRGYYDGFYFLNADGSLSNTDYEGVYDFNTNFFNVDVSYSWQFAPGSSFIITYKNQIARDPYPVERIEYDYSYHRDLRTTLNSPQTNSISLKVLYYLDYSYLKKKA